MPTEALRIMADASPIIGCVIGLIVFIFLFIKAQNKRDKLAHEEKIRKDEEHQKFVTMIIDEGKKREEFLKSEAKEREKDARKREEKLVITIDNYNCALKENNKVLEKISSVVNVIPKLEEDISDIKEKLDIK